MARRYAIRLGLLAASLTGAYMIFVSFLGSDLLTQVFGNEFSGFEELVWPVGTNQLLGAAFLGFPILLKAQRRGDRLLTGTVIGSVVMLVASVAFAMQWGIVGAAWGVALGAGVKNVLKAAFAVREPGGEGLTSVG
jgi:O-antigen/teichoic acid export membrane protein